MSLVKLNFAALVVFLMGCSGLISPVNQEQLRAVVAKYERITIEQTDEDPIIGLWSAIAGAERFKVAIIKPSTETSHFQFTGVVIGGSDSFVSRNGIESAVLRLSPTAERGVYEGESVWCLFGSCTIWRPSRIILTSANQFTVYHSTEFRTRGGVFIYT